LGCERCYNSPCTCEIKAEEFPILRNPYTIKREVDLYKEGCLQYLQEEGKIHLNPEEREKLMDELEKKKNERQ
jgi:hypothetical protein